MIGPPDFAVSRLETVPLTVELEDTDFVRRVIDAKEAYRLAFTRGWNEFAKGFSEGKLDPAKDWHFIEPDYQHGFTQDAKKDGFAACRDRVRELIAAKKLVAPPTAPRF